MNPYKSKAVDVEAMQLTISNYSNVSNWIGSKGYDVKYLTRPPMRQVSGIIIELPEDKVKAYFGDYIVAYDYDGFRVFSEDEFNLLYEEVTNG